MVQDSQWPGVIVCLVWCKTKEITIDVRLVCEAPQLVHPWVGCCCGKRKTTTNSKNKMQERDGAVEDMLASHQGSKKEDGC